MNIISLAIPIFFSMIAIEWFVSHKRGISVFKLNDTLCNLFCGAGSQVIGAFSAALTFGLYVWTFDNIRPLKWSTNAIWEWIVCTLLVDLGYYWLHRTSHRVQMFWATHIVHHQSEEYNLAVALRQPWFSQFHTWLFYIPLAVLGLPPEVWVGSYAVNLLYQFWIHTEAIDRMPRWFEAVMNTPSHHRVHHATNPRYLDRNYAGVFIVWDKMFGTFEPEVKGEKIRYGIVKQLGSFNLVWAVFHEWVGIAQDMWRAPWKHKLSYLLREPGWTHDGSRETSDQIRARWLERQGMQENSVSSENPIAGEAEPA